MMAPFALLGVVIAVTLFAAMVRGPVGVKLAPDHRQRGGRDRCAGQGCHHRATVPAS